MNAISQLAHYEKRAKAMTDDNLLFALRDISETLGIFNGEENDDYTRKLWAEWDAYIVELQKRRVNH